MLHFPAYFLSALSTRTLFLGRFLVMFISYVFCISKED